MDFCKPKFGVFHTIINDGGSQVEEKKDICSRKYRECDRKGSGYEGETVKVK